jgi:hypothetical protein
VTIVYDIPQHLEGGIANPDWLALRLGKPTASRMADLMATVKSGEAASRAKYRTEIALEIITGKRAEGGFTNAAMQWGTDQEPNARMHHEAVTGDMVIECSFAAHPQGLGGASPDGLIDDDGMWEGKCPETSTHFEYLLDPEKLAKKYRYQIQWQLACAERQWCKIGSFDPRMPEGGEYVWTLVKRDDALIAEMEAEVRKFMAEVHEMVAKFQARKVAA